MYGYLFVCVRVCVHVASYNSPTPKELKKMLPFLADWSAAWPGIDNLLQLVAPLALVVLMALLPMILMAFCKMEGHISLGVLQGALLGKLTLFTLVQVFFVSGTLFLCVWVYLGVCGWVLCVYVSLSPYIYFSLSLRVGVRASGCARVCLCDCVYVCVCVCVYVSISLSLSLYV
jgi:hypothetical protein